MGKRLLTFVNTHTVIKAERALRMLGFDVEVVSTPKEISSECGMSLLLKGDQLQEVLDALRREGVGVVGVYEWSQ